MNRPDPIIPLLRPRATIFDIACWTVLAALIGLVSIDCLREVLKWTA